MSAPEWDRVARSRPCPVCKRADWCLIATDGTAAICPRVESSKRAGNAGWLHRLAKTGPQNQGRITRRLRTDAPTANLSDLAERYRRSCDPKRLDGLARSLGLSIDSLNAFRAGWSGDHLAWTFPMSDPATGRVVGIRLRLPSGKKLSVKGGREGLFLPDPLDQSTGRLLISEGPTDAAALLDMGFPAAVGRPSCTGGTRHLVAMVRDRQPSEVVILADADEPGRAGAAVLARDLSLHARTVRVIAPLAGIKDVRAWKIAGATRPDVEDLIRRADPVRRTLLMRGPR